MVVPNSWPAVCSLLPSSCDTKHIPISILHLLLIIQIQSFEMKCFRRLLNIAYRVRIRNEEVERRIRKTIGPYENHLHTVTRRKLKSYGHVTRYCKDNLVRKSARALEKVKTKEEMDGQHHTMDETNPDLGRQRDPWVPSPDISKSSYVEEIFISRASSR